MRLTHVSLFAGDIETLTFSLKLGTRSSKFEVRTMLGLDADELTPRFHSFSLVERRRYYEHAMKQREIVIRLRLNPRYEIGETYSDIREELYRAISPNLEGLVTLVFNRRATTVAQIQGFIIKFEVPFFTKLPEAQFTIRCDDAMLRGVSPISYDVSTFPSTNPVLLGDQLSNAPHGMNLRVQFTAPEASFTIQDVETSPEWQFVVVPTGGFLAGDDLYISSEFGNKTVYMVRGGVETLLVDKVQPLSVWPIIFPGLNSFWMPDIDSIDWELIEYYPAYWGI